MGGGKGRRCLGRREQVRERWSKERIHDTGNRTRETKEAHSERKTLVNMRFAVGSLVSQCAHWPVCTLFALPR